MSEIQTFGIRHHGPGSAKSVRKALQHFEPDCLLIECPADAEALIKYVENEALKPPVSLLIYNPKNLTQAAYVPFAEFSPEWQAMKYALKKEIPIRFMDLPMNLTFTLDQLEAESRQISFDDHQKLSPEALEFRRDPIGQIAKLAGYTDSERWWEITFEQQENEEAIFTSILEMMAALRADEAHQEARRTLQREAFMRKTIRKAVKDGFQKIAIVCGAWHSPVLQDWKKFKTTADNAILKGIRKTTTKATWVPWSYSRLTFQSGYRSGVTSPAWYELLFQNRNEVVIRWMVKVARLFRNKDLDASAAHVIEAVRLADTLASLRNLSISGMEEMREAAVSIFCEGDISKLQLIEDKLIIGKKVGKVPPEIPAIPLQQDLAKTIKSARLSSYWENTEALWLKANANNSRGGIDLREEKDLMKSHLLHRLNILGIPWGQHMKGSQLDIGSFKEYWKMKWKPDFVIRIIEAGMWGNTVEEASTLVIQKKATEIQTLPELTVLVQAALNSNLTLAINQLIQQLQNLSALTTDIYHLMEALPSLVYIVRYGNTRQTDIHAVRQVVHQLIPRICIALPSALVSLDENTSKDAFEKLLATQRAINTLNDPSHNAQWYAALKSLAQLSQIHPILKGACTRILFEKNKLDALKTADQMYLALSRGNAKLAAAQWLEGFLHGSGLLLIHNVVLWNLLDDWLDNLSMEDFQDVLPLLRRTFANFSNPERAKMMGLAKRGQIDLSVGEEKESLDWERAEEVLGTVQLLLGC